MMWDSERYKTNNTSSQYLFLKLRLKKTISDCRKYRICLGSFIFTFTYIQLSKNRVCTEDPSWVQLLLETSQISPNTNIHGKIQQCCHQHGAKLFSVHYDIVLNVRCLSHTKQNKTKKIFTRNNFYSHSVSISHCKTVKHCLSYFTSSCLSMNKSTNK